MIEDMENKYILDKVRMKGMNQGIWLAVQELAHDGRWTQAAEELVSSCGLTEDECRKLQEESESFNDEMLEFIDMVFKHDTMNEDYGVKTLDDIWYHEIGSVFKYNIGSKEVELEVVESSDASCEGCVFNNSKNYYCKDTNCIDMDRKDDIDIIYKEVKKIMSLIDKLEDLVAKVDTEYQKKMEAVIREIVTGMPEESVRHAAECMCTDRMGNMMDIDLYILHEENRPYKYPYLKELLEDRIARVAKMHEDKSYTYNIDDNYWCATCGSHSHKKDSETGYCWHCDTVNWVKEDGADVRV